MIKISEHDTYLPKRKINQIEMIWNIRGKLVTFEKVAVTRNVSSTAAVEVIGIYDENIFL